MVLALTNDHVTRGAGTAPAAVVLERNVVRQRDVEQRPRPAVVGQGVLLVIDVDGDVHRQEGHPVNGHQFGPSIVSARLDARASLSARSIMASASRSVARLRATVRSRIESRSVPFRAVLRSLNASSIKARSSTLSKSAA